MSLNQPSDAHVYKLYTCPGDGGQREVGGGGGGKSMMKYRRELKGGWGGGEKGKKRERQKREGSERDDAIPVSYTHLTLPTRR